MREFNGTELDFWIGDWDATWQDGHGRNRIGRILRRKVIHERFSGVGDDGSRLVGQSWSVFDPARQLWRQTWVDDAGGYYDLVGGWVGEWFALERDSPELGTSARQRMVFRDISETDFRWTWEYSAGGNVDWQTRWEIRYHRRA